MNYTDVQMMRKQALYIPKLMRAGLVKAKAAARSALPARSGRSFEQFSQSVDTGTRDTILDLLDRLGFKGKTKGLRFRGVFPTSDSWERTMYEMAPHGATLSQTAGRAMMKPNISMRRYSPGNMLADKADDSVRALNSRASLFTGAPGNNLAASEIMAGKEPMADIFMSDKYLQRNRQGNILLDPDVPVDAITKRFGADYGQYIKPYRTHRLVTGKAAEPFMDQRYGYMQAVRQSGGRLDDVGGFILYPNGYGAHARPGYVFTTNTTEAPFTSALRDYQTRTIYGDLNATKQYIKNARSRLMHVFQAHPELRDDAKLMEAARAGKLPRMTVKGNVLSILPRFADKKDAIKLTADDRGIYLANFLNALPK